MIVGTAGHIDHGKTSLVRALTGRDTDRLPEEKRRGISIELGYAFMPVDSGVLAFIDVPGHDRFVHTMVAGATGVDVALLVIAADDGVMPQTVEHLEILRLLGVVSGAIALTKIDAVDAARVRTAREEIATWVRDTPESAWPVFPVSSTTGDGVGALKTFLTDAAATFAQHDADRPLRLAIDRVFSLPGIGTIVTGTVHSGSVREGDAVEIVPSGRRARVRSLHAQDQAIDKGVAGERVALNLAGVDRADVQRGEWVQAPGLANVTLRFDATLRMAVSDAKPLTSSTLVHLHHGAQEGVARIAVLDRTSVGPGESALVGLTLQAPFAASKGDRFIVRDASAQRTLGGGIVLDIDPPVRHRRTPARFALLQALRDASPCAALKAQLDEQPVLVERLAGAWNLSHASTAALLDEAQARVAAGTAIAREHWAALSAAVAAALATAHRQEPDMPGLEQNRLRRIAAPRIADTVFAALVDEMVSGHRLARRGAFLALPEHRIELRKQERVQWEKLKPLLMDPPFNPPRARDLARSTGLSETDVRTLMRNVTRVGEAMLVATDHYFLASSVAKLADVAADLARDEGAVRAAAFRDRIGCGRKVAIHILEYFDRVGYTRRLRDDHLVRGPNPWRAQSGGASAEE